MRTRSKSLVDVYLRRFSAPAESVKGMINAKKKENSTLAIMNHIEDETPPLPPERILRERSLYGSAEEVEVY